MEETKCINRIFTTQNKDGGEFIMKRKANEQKNVQRNAFLNQQQKSKQENARNSQEFGLEQDFSNVQNQEQQQKQQNERAKRKFNENNRSKNR